MTNFALGLVCGNGGCQLPTWVDSSLIPLVYIIASIFFIRGIKLMGRPDTARRGNLESSIGMLLAVGSPILNDTFLLLWLEPDLRVALLLVG